ncbi:MAG: hypothetical protein GXZ04_03320 [Clostridiales bacterium]|nr:hypothetical protein [Clostridiales bacterium]
MKRSKLLCGLLALLMVSGILLAMPVIGAATSTGKLINVPPTFATPKTQPTPKPPPVTLTLEVDKEEAHVGETLTFTATARGGSRMQSMWLWIVREKERLEVLPENRENKWTYEPEEPGIYWGVLIYSDSLQTVNKKGKEIIVKLPPTPEPPTPDPPTPAPPTPEPPPEELPSEPMQVMSLTKHIWITPIEDFTLLEGTTLEQIPVVVSAKEEVSDIQMKFKGLAPYLKFVKNPRTDGHLG